jgi:CRISPR-associated endoribonuclease Cas6
MRLRINLQPHSPIEFSVHYNGILQGFVYAQLEPCLARWLHQNGYGLDEKRFRMFTFSRLSPANGSRYHVCDGRIRFDGPVSFVLSSINADILLSLAERLLAERRARLGRYDCAVTGVEIVPKPRIDPRRPIVVRAASPITIHTTVHDAGNKRAYYYAPWEEDWSYSLLCNLVNKAAALGWVCDAYALLADSSIHPHRVNERDEKVISYKGGVVKGGGRV